MAANESKEEEFLYLLTEGSDLLRAGSVANARDYFERALLLEPGNEQALNLLGLALHRLEHFKEAEDIFRDLIHNNPVEPSLRLNLAMVLLKRSDLEGARHELEVVIDLNPDHPRAASYMGLVHERREAFASAALWYERAGNQKRAMQMRVRAEAALQGDTPQSPGADPSFLDGAAVVEDETQRSTSENADAPNAFGDLPPTQSESGAYGANGAATAEALPSSDIDGDVAPPPPSAEEIGLRIESTDEHLSMPPVDVDMMLDGDDDADESSPALLPEFPRDEDEGDDDDFASPTQEFTVEAIRQASIAASEHKAERESSDLDDLQIQDPPPPLSAALPDLTPLAPTPAEDDELDISFDVEPDPSDNDGSATIDSEIVDGGSDSPTDVANEIEDDSEETFAVALPSSSGPTVDTASDDGADDADSVEFESVSQPDTAESEPQSPEAAEEDRDADVDDSAHGEAPEQPLTGGAEAAALTAARAESMRRPNEVPDEGSAQQARSASLGFTLDVETGKKTSSSAESAADTESARGKSGQSVRAFADDNDAFEGANQLQRRDDGAMIVPIDEVAYLRTDLLVSLSGQFEIEPLNRRYRGRRTDSLFGGNQAPMVAVMGAGTAVFDPGALDVTILDLANEELYLVEGALASFSAGLVWENGRLPSEGGPDLDIVHLRGTGSVVLGNGKRVYAHTVVANAPVTLQVDRLVGWNGQVVPYRGDLPGLPETADKPAIVRFEGSGLVFGT